MCRSMYNTGDCHTCPSKHMQLAEQPGCSSAQFEGCVGLPKQNTGAGCGNAAAWAYTLTVGQYTKYLSGLTHDTLVLGGLPGALDPMACCLGLLSAGWGLLCATSWPRQHCTFLLNDSDMWSEIVC